MKNSVVELVVGWVQLKLPAASCGVSARCAFSTNSTTSPKKRREGHAVFFEP